MSYSPWGCKESDIPHWGLFLETPEGDSVPPFFTPATGKDRASCQSGGAPAVRPGAVAQSPGREAGIQASSCVGPGKSGLHARGEYFFALITEEGFLVSPCYSLELCIQMGISFLFSFAFPRSSPTHRVPSRETLRVPTPLHLSPFSPPDGDRSVDSPAWSGRDSRPSRPKALEG